MKTIKGPELLTRKEVAEIFRVDVRTVHRWEKQGRIGSIRTPAGHARYSRPEIEYLLHQRGAQ